MAFELPASAEDAPGYAAMARMPKLGLLGEGTYAQVFRHVSGSAARKAAGSPHGVDCTTL
jgi:hypothetical protein